MLAVILQEAAKHKLFLAFRRWPFHKLLIAPGVPKMRRSAKKVPQFFF